MVKFILGAKGAGKTKWLIDNANKDMKEGNGLLGMDYDLEKIYVDGIYKVIDLGIEDLKALYEKLNEVAEKTNTDFYINVDFVKDELPAELQNVSEEVIAE